MLEFASPVFFSRLTQEQSKAIENVQRKAFSIILGSTFKNNEMTLTALKQEKLSNRRVAAAIKFGKKCIKNPKHADMFPKNQPGKESESSKDALQGVLL